MTNITLFRENGRLVGFDSVGHSDFDCEGSDIVCSAVSVLTQTALMGLVEYLKLDVAYNIDEDIPELYCMLSQDISDSDFEKAEIILETMTCGIKSVASDNGDYIRIIEKEV